MDRRLTKENRRVLTRLAAGERLYRVPSTRQQDNYLFDYVFKHPTYGHVIGFVSFQTVKTLLKRACAVITSDSYDQTYLVITARGYKMLYWGREPQFRHTLGKESLELLLKMSTGCSLLIYAITARGKKAKLSDGTSISSNRASSLIINNYVDPVEVGTVGDGNREYKISDKGREVIRD